MGTKNQPPPPSPVGSEDNSQNREDEIFKVVRGVLENTGEIRKIRALLQAKVLNIVRGGDNNPIVAKIEKDPRTNMLDALIMEYFHWFGYQYTIEMFGSESGTEAVCPPRDSIEKFVGNHPGDLPILLTIVNNLLELNKISSAQ